MGRSFLNQALQVAASKTYDDAISSPHTIGVAEAQTTLEGDLNVVRTLMKDVIGEANWFDTPDMTIKNIASKYFIAMIHPSGFDNVATGTGTSSSAFDTVIKSITNHNDGGGSSTVGGVILNATKTYRLEIRNHSTQNPIDDGNNNEVYGKLTWSGTAYIVNWYSTVSGVETAYNFLSSVAVDLAYVAVSRRYEDLDWDIFLNNGWHDVAGPTGTIADDNVIVDGMTLLLNGLTTQAQVNLKLDKLGSTASGEGASGIAIEDVSDYYTGTDLESVTNELETQIGGNTSTTYAFTEQNVLIDNDYVYPALNKLDLKWGDLASTATGEGASLVGVEDDGGFFTGTEVEAVLQEIGQKLEDVSGWVKVSETVPSPITSGTSHTIPGGNTFTPSAGGLHMDVYYNGQLLLAGAGNDYTEDAGGTSIKFLFTIPSNSNLTFSIRK